MRQDAPLEIAPATAADLPEIDTYLAERSDTCMLMCSNLREVGLAWSAPGGAPLQAQYVLARCGGIVIGIAGHAWNGNVLLQADAHAGELAAGAVRRSGRPVSGLLGQFDQVASARAALGLRGTAASLESYETLMSLALDQLAIPPALRSGAVTGRRAHATDRALLIPWRAAYLAETGQQGAGPAATERTAAATIDSGLAARRVWVVEHDGAGVATCTHNAVLPDSVQVGGVYTPPALRGRGHARAAVATSLIDARAAGATRAILFTPRPDAIAAYRALGFEPIGRYAIVLFSASP
jgi:GNAT superfamily N-acetyltransferase